MPQTNFLHSDLGVIRQYEIAGSPLLVPRQADGTAMVAEGVEAHCPCATTGKKIRISVGMTVTVSVRIGLPSSMALSVMVYQD